VTGTTESTNFPAKSSISCVLGTAASAPVFLQQKCLVTPVTKATDSFVAKLSSDGGSLLFSTSLPGMSVGTPLADGRGGVFFTAAQASPRNMFLFHLDATGASLLLADFLGINGQISSLALDSAGNFYRAGSSYWLSGSALSIPTTANAFSTQFSNSGLNGSPGGLDNGFLLEVNAAGTQIIYGTYFGPKYYGTDISGMLVAPDGSLYFMGTSNAQFAATQVPL
jgi:hypothetical protein